MTLSRAACWRRQQAATAQLAASFSDLWALMNGLDAETPQSGSNRLADYADQLDQMSFSATD